MGTSRTVAAAVAAAGLGAALLLTGCGGEASGPAPGAAAGSGETIALRATDFKYEPAQITLAGPGDLTIRLENKGMVEHDFMIEGVTGKLLVKPNQSGTQTFKITKPGTYVIACTVAGHRDAGMKGTLVVG
jgi:plastocyanin